MEDQMTIDDYLDISSSVEPELLHCQLTEGFHWLRITSGHTPDEFKEFVDFELNGYEYVYKNTPIKDAIISAFDGSVKVVEWKEEVA